MEKLFKVSEKDCFERLSKISFTLKSLRKEKKLTQKQVAEALGVRYQSYQAYERGITYPSLENFIKLSMIFEVSMDYLIDRDLY